MSTMPIERSTLKDWGIAFRAFALPASIVPVLLGSAIAWYHTGSFNWLFFFLALIGGVMFHTACNMINDYYDFVYGVDSEDMLGGSGILTSGRMHKNQLMAGAIACLAIGSIIGIYFLWIFSSQYLLGWPLLAIGGFGLLATIFYTATPNNAKYNALGEPLVFLAMGTGMVLGAYFVQTGTITWLPVILSIPISLNVMAILSANNTRDITNDKKADIKTIATLLGATGARVFLTVTTGLAYLSVVAFAVFSVMPYAVLLPILTIPLAIPLIRLFWTVRDEKHESLSNTDEMAAKLHLAFGVMLTVGVIISKLWLS